MTRYGVPDGVGWVEVADGAVVAVFGRQPRVALSPSALEVWRLASEALSVGEISQRLSGSYDGLPDDVSDIVATTLDRLVAAGLLVESRRSSPTGSP